MSDWEDAEVEIPVAPKFEDEELSDNEPLKPQQKLPPVKKKTDIKQKNLDREAEKLSKLNEVQETENERRIRLKNEVLDADLKNVIDLVGDLELPKSSSNTFSNLDQDPQTIQELDVYEKRLIEKVYNFDHYYHFTETLIRDLLVPLDLDEVRKISSTISAMINEKQKQKKTTGGKKKKAKQAVNVQKEDLRDVGNLQYDEFDDFM